MAVKWTDEQKEAIYDRKNNILVSASAGSGKTTVMIQRIVDLILNDEIPVSNFLVVTFTKASAADMKSKLINKLLENSENEFALSQVEQVAVSDISNLHSFCSRLISTYFYEAEVDPSYHIIDEMESSYLKTKAFDLLFDRKQEDMDVEFFKIFEIFQKKRKGHLLKQVIESFNDYLNSNVDGEKWFFDAIEKTHNTTLEKNVCANLINHYVANAIKKDAKKVDDFADECLKCGQQKMYEHFVELSSKLKSVKFSNPYMVNAQNVFDIKPGRTPPAGKDFKFLSEKAKMLKTDLKLKLDNYKDNFVSPDEKLCLDGLVEAKKNLLSLYALVKEFNEIYSKLKKDTNGLDFNDLEKYALKVLANEEVLSSVKAKYQYVFVDEYQDINSVQEKIISLVSGEDNRFMVGDVKQSIYRFRLCDPDIFLQKYTDFGNGLSKSKLVKLNANFRSDKKILKFVDEVFSGVMTEEFGDIDYAKDSIFVPGEKNIDNPDSVNIRFIDTTKIDEEKVAQSGVYSVKNHTQIAEQKEKAIIEASVVAEEIAKLVDPLGEFKYEFSDIAILVGTRNETTSSFVEELRKYDIPVSNDEKVDLMEKSHIQELLCFVKLLCNERDDYTLFKVMKSKLFKFSNDDLVKIRLIDKKLRFFEIFDKFDELKDENVKSKVIKLKDAISKYKNLAKVLKIKDLILKIVEDFSIYKINLTLQNGETLNDELDYFVGALPNVDVFEFVINYKELSVFYENETSGDAVKMMTIHKSKGMEFKAVFLINTGNRFNFQSTYGSILFNKQFGVGMDFYNLSTRIQSPTIPISAIRMIEKRKLVEEQQRVLYVALTRAKEKLFIVYSDMVENIASEMPERPKSYGDWFKKFVYSELHGMKNEIINFKDCTRSVDDLCNVEEKKDLIFIDEDVQEPDWFEYKFNKESAICLKNSISRILKDEKSEEYDKKFFEQEETLSSADRGTVYHKVLQNVDFENLQNIEKQLCKIIENLDEDERKLIDENLILKTLKIPLFVEIASADKILQEREFCAKMPAKMVDENIVTDDEFILQGVVDLIAVFDDEIWILDYKTGKFDESRLEKYGFQINTYANVCERAFGRRVTRKFLCFIDLQKIIEI